MEANSPSSPCASIATAIFGLAPEAKGFFVFMAMLWTITDRRKACPAITSVLSLKTAKGLCGLRSTNGVDSFRDPRVTTFSAVEGLSKDSAAGVLASRDGTIWVANADSLDHIVERDRLSQFAGRSPGIRSRPCWKIAPGTCGWEWMTDSYLFKDGRFRRLPEPNHQPLGMVVGMIEDIDGNIWAECSAVRESLYGSAISRCKKEFSASQVPPGRISLRIRREEFGSALAKESLRAFANGALQKYQIPLRRARLRSTNQIIAEADGSVLAAFDDGLVGLRQGKAQRMTTKNGLPCDTIYSFIQDKEKRWWLNTQCGVVEFSDSELQRWWANPDAVIQTRLYDVLDGARPSARLPFNSAASSPDGRVWFVNSGCRADARSLPALAKSATGTDLHRVGRR